MITLDAPSSEQSNLQVLSASEWRTDRVNAFLYGPMGSGKTDLGVRFPKPVLVDTGENGALTVKYMLATGRLHEDLPIIPSTDFDTIKNIVTDPKYILGGFFKGSKWEGYENEMESIVVDTVTTMEGWCLEEVLEKAQKEDPDLRETEIMKRKMRAFFRAAWNLPYNTVLLGHDSPGRAETRDGRGRVIMSKKNPGPLLTGQLATQGPALTDFFVYMRQEHSMGNEDVFVAFTEEHPDGFPARTRVKGFLDKRIENPTYDHFREALDKLEAKLKEDGIK